MPIALSRHQFLIGSAAGAALSAVNGLVAGAQDFPLTEIARGVFVHQGQHALFSPSNAGDISNLGFVVGLDAVAVIDTGGSPVVGKAMREAIGRVTPLPVRYVINTHMHPDHVFGNAAFVSASPTFVGHRKLARALHARANRYLAINRDLLGDTAFEGTTIVAPTLEVEGQVELDLGGRSLILVARDTAHTDNDLTVYDKSTGTLFLGDLLFSGHIPTLDGSIRGWLKLLAELRSEQAERVVPGHGPASMSWPGALADEDRYLTRLAADVRAVVKSGGTIEEAVASAGTSETGAWLLFEHYHARNVTAAFAELEWD